MQIRLHPEKGLLTLLLELPLLRQQQLHLIGKSLFHLLPRQLEHQVLWRGSLRNIRGAANLCLPLLNDSIQVFHPQRYEA